MDSFASTDKETPYQGATVRAFAFDGDETKFRTWEGKSIALASAKGFLLALTQEPKMKMLTVEEFEYGEVIVYTTSAASLKVQPDVTTSSQEGSTTTVKRAATASTTRATTSSENRQYLARASAWTYLNTNILDASHEYALQWWEVPGIERALIYSMYLNDTDSTDY